MPRLISCSPEIERLKREARPGACYLCDELLPARPAPRTEREKRRAPKRREWCRSKECKALYFRIYVQDWRKQVRAEERA